MKITLDKKESGSYDELVKYVQAVIEDNYNVKPDVTYDDYPNRSARAIVISITNRLGIERT